jgi:integrase
MALKKLTGPNKWRINASAWDKVKGQAVGKQVTFTGTKSEATIREAELLKELKARCSLTTAQRTSTFEDLIRLYKHNIETRGRCSNNHANMVDLICRELGHLKIEGFAECFEGYRKRLICGTTVRGKPRKAASVNRYTSIVKAIFNHAVKLDILQKNPISSVRFPRLKETARDRYLNEEERLRLLNTIREHRPHILPIVRFMLLVPCRVSELTTAKREQYNPFTRTIYIPDSKAGVPIYKPVPEELLSYFNAIPSNCPWLFYWIDNTGKYRQIISPQRPWRFCLKTAGIENVRIHDLRHISATDLYAAGNPERAIMDVAGWKTPMLSTYRHKDSFRSAIGIKFGTTEETQKPDVAFSYAM